VRQQHARPLLDQLKEFLDTALSRVSGKSTLARAIRYALSRWQALERYLTDGRLEMSNNAAERAMKSPVLGRKNYLFCGSDAGRRRAACIYTITETCLCRARHSALYAARRTMPSGSGTTHGCRSAVGFPVAAGSVPFGIVWPLRAPLGSRVIGRWGGSGFACRPDTA